MNLRLLPCMSPFTLLTVQSACFRRRVPANSDFYTRSISKGNPYVDENPWVYSLLRTHVTCMKTCGLARAYNVASLHMVYS